MTSPAIPRPIAPHANFDGLARHYRSMEFLTFGPILGRCRAAFLPDLKTARRALILGDGDGRFTAQLLRVNRRVQVDAVDASAAMLDALTDRAGAHSGRVRAHHADARNWIPEAGPYDLVVSHFFLDCLATDEVRTLAAKIRRFVPPAAAWVVSEFAIPRNGFGRFVAAPIVRLLYLAFGLLTGLRVRSLPDHRVALGEAGFTLEKCHVLLCGLLVSELWRSPGDPLSVRPR